MRQFTLIFYCFFDFFGSDFFALNGFPNSVIVRSRSSFLFSQWKFFELFVRTCPAMFFNSSSPSMILTTWLLGIDFFIGLSDLYCFAVKICVRDGISAFRSIAWLNSFRKRTSELTYGTEVNIVRVVNFWIFWHNTGYICSTRRKLLVNFASLMFLFVWMNWRRIVFLWLLIWKFQVTALSVVLRVY